MAGSFQELEINYIRPAEFTLLCIVRSVEKLESLTMAINDFSSTTQNSSRTIIL